MHCGLDGKISIHIVYRIDPYCIILMDAETWTNILLKWSRLAYSLLARVIGEGRPTRTQMIIKPDFTVQLIISAAFPARLGTIINAGLLQDIAPLWSNLVYMPRARFGCSDIDLIESAWEGEECCDALWHLMLILSRVIGSSRLESRDNWGREESPDTAVSYYN